MNSKFYYYLWFVLGGVGLLLTASLIIYCHINDFPALSICCECGGFALQTIALARMYERYREQKDYERFMNALQELIKEQDPFEEYADTTEHSDNTDDNVSDN